MSHTPPVAAGDTFHAPAEQTVNTVLGPIPASELGVVAVHEALLSVIPGAQYAPDISMDRAEMFEILAGKLTGFRQHGGQTIVDSTGMFHGRDVKLYEALSRSTGVHIVASTGMGPEEMLGGYFLTPQTNPPTPWPAGKFADLFSKEVTEGMVVPRVERRGAAGLVTTAAARAGMTPTEESLFRGTKWVVFEPNDEALWAQIRLNVGSFMASLHRQGAFQGASARDAYFVRCDGKTTTQHDIDRGIVNIVVGFRPLKPAEFVVLSIQQLAGQSPA